MTNGGICLHSDRYLYAYDLLEGGSVALVCSSCFTVDSFGLVSSPQNVVSSTYIYNS